MRNKNFSLTSQFFSFLFVLLFFLGTSCSFDKKNETINLESFEKSNFDKNDLDKENLKGKVSRVVEKYFEEIKLDYNPITDSVFVGGRVLKIIIEVKFNESGNRIEENTYSPDSILTGKIVYEYENGKKVQEIEFKATNEIELSRKFEYDQNGNHLKVVVSKGDNDFVDNYVYNEKGYYIEQKSYDSKGDLYKIHEYEYDENGNGIKTIIYDGNGSLNLKLDIFYNAAGEQIKSLVYNSAEELITTLTYEYELDKINNWIESKLLYDEKIFSITDRYIEYYE